MQIYKCFGCGASGDIINFLMNYEGLTFPEALEQLADRVGIKLEKRQQTSADKNRERVLEAIHLAAEYYHYLLTKHEMGKKALEYLKKRGVANQLISDYKLGYALDSWDGLQRFLVKRKKFTIDELVAAGLIIRSERGGYYDRFRGRIMFPQLTYSGKIVGFSARSLDPEAKEAKYINSPETDYYHKSEILFGLNLAKRAIRDKQRVILVEGEFDAISSHQIGLKETVAIKGSALTSEQAALIRRLTHNLVLALDADSAGQEAMKRGIGVCENQALNLRIVELVGSKDPDGLAQTEPEKLKQAVNNAESVYSFLINQACKQFGTTTGEGKKQAAQAVMPDLVKIENAIEKEFYIGMLAKKLQTSQGSLFEELQKTKIPTNLKTDETKKPQFGRRELLERQVLGLAMQSGSPKTELGLILNEWFSEPYLKKLHQDLVSAAMSVHQKGAEMVSRLPESVQQVAVDVFTMQSAWLEQQEMEISQLLTQTRQRLEQMWAKQRLVEIAKQLNSLGDDDEQMKQLKEEYRRLAQITTRAEAGRDDEAKV